MPSVAPPIAELTDWSLTLDRRRVQAGEMFVARLKVEIAKGYHMYSISQPAGGPLPTHISAVAGFSVTEVEPWPKPTRMFDPKFAMETECHAGRILFDVYVQVEATLPEGNHEVVFQVEYQLCDEHTCLRPETKELCAAVRVEAAEPAAAVAVQDVTSASGQAAQSSEQKLERLFEEHKTGDKWEAGLRRILKDDPAFIRGHLVLAQRRAARGDSRSQRAMLREGLAANPGNDALQYQLAACLGTPKRRQLLNKYARQFPKSPYAVVALMELAKLSTSRHETRKILERSQRLTAGQPRAIWIERSLYPLLAASDPARTVRLIKSASRTAAKSDGFFLQGVSSGLMDFYTSVAEVRRLLKKGKTKQAASAARLLQEPDIPHLDPTEAERVLVALIKAKALAASGHIEPAYELLIQHPLLLQQEELLDLAARVGARLRKSRKRVEDDAWQRTLQQTYPLAEFEIPAKRGRSVRAGDYRGQVLLVNVWNPG